MREMGPELAGAANPTRTLDNARKQSSLSGKDQWEYRRVVSAGEIWGRVTRQKWATWCQQ